MAHRNCHGILVISFSALFASVLETNEWGRRIIQN
jgi:hypothetical protein